MTDRDVSRVGGQVGQDDSNDVRVGLQRLFVGLERLDAAWRRDLGLSANEQLMVFFLSEGVTAPSGLARLVGMTTAGMTNLIDRLEQDGHVKRERHADDGRRVLLVLTKKGFRIRRRLESLHAEFADMAASYGEAEAAVIYRFLSDSAALAEAAVSEHDSN